MYVAALLVQCHLYRVICMFVNRLPGGACVSHLLLYWGNTLAK